nr:MAG TPA: hypothetical protein [Caudoviricetes sp.]
MSIASKTSYFLLFTIFILSFYELWLLFVL